MSDPTAHQPEPDDPQKPAGGTAGMAGMLKDPPTLAAAGLIAAEVFAVVAGWFGFLADPSGAGFRGRLLNLTSTVDVGDVALLGIAIALLLLTVDPPGGIPRSLLMDVAAVLAAVMAVYGVVRALVVISEKGSALLRFDGFVATIGVALAASTIAFYAASESFLKKRP